MGSETLMQNFQKVYGWWDWVLTQGIAREVPSEKMMFGRGLKPLFLVLLLLLLLFSL